VVDSSGSFRHLASLPPRWRERRNRKRGAGPPHGDQPRSITVGCGDRCRRIESASWLVSLDPQPRQRMSGARTSLLVAPRSSVTAATATATAAATAAVATAATAIAAATAAVAAAAIAATAVAAAAAGSPLGVFIGAPAIGAPGRITEPTLGEELLLSGRKDKLAAAILASQRLVRCQKDPPPLIPNSTSSLETSGVCQGSLDSQTRVPCVAASLRGNSLPEIAVAPVYHKCPARRNRKHACRKGQEERFSASKLSCLSPEERA
jgi:hypothetical protein